MRYILICIHFKKWMVIPFFLLLLILMTNFGTKGFYRKDFRYLFLSLLKSENTVNSHEKKPINDMKRTPSVKTFSISTNKRFFRLGLWKKPSKDFEKTAFKQMYRKMSRLLTLTSKWLLKKKGSYHVEIW